MLALELLCNSLCGALPKILEGPGLYGSDRQSQTRRQGCHVGNCRMNRSLFADELVLNALIFLTTSSARM